MNDKRVSVYDRQLFRKKLIEFMKSAREYMKEDLNEDNIYSVLYTTELFRNSIYKCIRFNRPIIAENGRLQDDICKYESEYSDGILKIPYYP